MSKRILLLEIGSGCKTAFMCSAILEAESWIQTLSSLLERILLPWTEDYMMLPPSRHSV